MTGKSQPDPGLTENQRRVPPDYRVGSGFARVTVTADAGSSPGVTWSLRSFGSVIFTKEKSNFLVNISKVQPTFSVFNPSFFFGFPCLCLSCRKGCQETRREDARPLPLPVGLEPAPDPDRRAPSREEQVPEAQGGTGEREDGQRGSGQVQPWEGMRRPPLSFPPHSYGRAGTGRTSRQPTLPVAPHMGATPWTPSSRREDRRTEDGDLWCW